jgi:hypothetical protein
MLRYVENIALRFCIVLLRLHMGAAAPISALLLCSPKSIWIFATRQARAPLYLEGFTIEDPLI